MIIHRPLRLNQPGANDASDVLPKRVTIGTNRVTIFHAAGDAFDALCFYVECIHPGIHFGEHTMTFTHQQGTAHEVLIRQAVDQFCTALNSIFIGDLKPMCAAWSHTDDVTYMGPDGAYRKGWAKVLAGWERQAAMNLGGSVDIVDVHIIAWRRLAIVDNQVKGGHFDPEGNPQVVSLRATEVFRQEAGAWKVIGVYTDVLPLLADEAQRRIVNQ
jgi:ketosteroid isomerase-like protein